MEQTTLPVENVEADIGPCAASQFIPSWAYTVGHFAMPVICYRRLSIIYRTNVCIANKYTSSLIPTGESTALNIVFSTRGGILK